MARHRASLSCNPAEALLHCLQRQSSLSARCSPVLRAALWARRRLRSAADLIALSLLTWAVHPAMLRWLTASQPPPMKLMSLACLFVFRCWTFTPSVLAEDRWRALTLVARAALVRNQQELIRGQFVMEKVNAPP